MPSARSIQAAFVLLLMTLCAFRNAAAQNGAVVTGTVDTTGMKEGDPVGALWRSALLPGWGQAYNGQLYKTPIVIGLIGGMLGFAIYHDNQFNNFNEAYLYAAYIDEVPHPFPEYEASYDSYPGISTTGLRSQRDSHRRSRNIFAIGTVLAYGLNVLDAYVNGQLVGFDVGEDLSATLAPDPSAGGLTLRFIF